ncbi:MAG TPA: hypothetical protein PLW70_04600 [Bacteroidales bacterium]|nr:hypothetical protein [Bacteroidales bacterium]HQB19482.1 hypothetical protein [Bacteroidales bacterium]
MNKSIYYYLYVVIHCMIFSHPMSSCYSTHFDRINVRFEIVFKKRAILKARQPFYQLFLFFALFCNTYISS